jgi:hypothetical protein
MKVLFNTILFVSVLKGLCSFASSIEEVTGIEDEILISYRFKVRGDDFNERVCRACLNPKVVSMNFSAVKLSNEDLEMIFEALVERESAFTGKPHDTIKFIDLSRGTFSEAGFLRFLGNFQYGRKEPGSEARIYPDVRDTILRIGLALTDEFIENMQEMAPSIFAGGIEILE